MIKTENILITEGVQEMTLKKTYSNSDFKIRKKGTNETYDEAIDVPTSSFEYEETDKFTTTYIRRMYDEGKITQAEMDELL